MNTPALSQVRRPLFCHRRLGWFLLISLLGHLLLLWLWLSLPPSKPIAAEPTGSMQLRLQATTAKATDMPAQTEPIAAPALPALDNTPTPKDMTATPSAQGPASATRQTETAPKSRPPQAEIDVETIAASPAQPSAEAEQATPIAAIQTADEIAVSTQTADAPVAEEAQHLLGQLRHELARHFHYPALAVRRGWQGTVQLGFEIDTGGRISNIHVAQSSGHALLDRAAVSALGRVGQLSLPVKHHHQLRFPVMYRLEEG
ncbi:MAG: energy transducer TonB [Gammaproteobacteria bacterium]|nr:energy transducer TonB [Gammaproteobacteria bacterium]